MQKTSGLTDAPAVWGRSVLFLILALATVTHGLEQRVDPTWGPLRSGDCGSDGQRRVFAEYLNPGADPDPLSACRTTYRNVMGRELKPVCTTTRFLGIFKKGIRGEWETPDVRCAGTVPDPRDQRSQQPSDSSPLEGYADLHVHQMANVGFGGSIVWGSAYGSPDAALSPIPDRFRPGHETVEGAVTGHPLQVFLGGHLRRYWHGERGYPSFVDWPQARIWTHQQTYEDWLFRAYRGGLRLMVMLAANSEDMFGRGENSLPGVLKHRRFQKPLPGRSGNDMESLEWQIREAYRMQDSIDARYGGAGRGWYRIVRDPEEADRVVSEGKLAVILGTEIQHLFNCDMDRPVCTHADIVEGLNRLEAMGVNYVFPVHHKVNQFGGPAMFQPLNAGPAQPCRDLLHRCSTVGLSPLGVFLIEELMARGMLIDTEHLSRQAFGDAMSIVERWQYPVMAGHVVPLDLQIGAAQNERARSSEEIRRILRVGGMVAPILSVSAAEYAGGSNPVPVRCDDPRQGGGADQWANAYLLLRDLAAGEDAPAGTIALGGDWNGFAGWPGPRFEGRDKCRRRTTRTGDEVTLEPRVQYPITLPSALVPSAAAGTRTLELFEWPAETRRWDYNSVGVAHIGMLPDFLENLRMAGLSEADLNPVYRSARRVVEVWKTARQRTTPADRHALRWVPDSPFDVLSFEQHDRTREVEAAPGRVICATRDYQGLGYVTDASCRTVARVTPAHSSDVDARVVVYHAGRCLAVDRGELRSRDAVQRTCDTTLDQKWEVVRQSDGRVQIANARSKQCLSVDRHPASKTVALSSCDAGPATMWTAVRTGNTFRFRGTSDLCMEIPRESRKENELLILSPCTGGANQQWSVEAFRSDDFHRLYQADRNRTRWAISGSAPDLVPVALGTAPICRSSDGNPWLGLVQGGECVGADGDGRASRSTTFELLHQVR